MFVKCPNCGLEVQVRGLGRKRLDIGLNKVLDALRGQRSVVAAATELKCSPGYVFNMLKSQKLRAQDVIDQADGERDIC
jgi:hypothetical protein